MSCELKRNCSTNLSRQHWLDIIITIVSRYEEWDSLQCGAVQGGSEAGPTALKLPYLECCNTHTYAHTHTHTLWDVTLQFSNKIQVKSSSALNPSCIWYDGMSYTAGMCHWLISQHLMCVCVCVCVYSHKSWEGSKCCMSSMHVGVLRLTISCQ